MGENVLAAVQEYARVLAGEPAAPRAGDAGGSVYFDLWGRCMVRCRVCSAQHFVCVASPLFECSLWGRCMVG